MEPITRRDGEGSTWQRGHPARMAGSPSAMRAGCPRSQHSAPRRGLPDLLLHGYLAAAGALLLAFFLCFTALPAHDLWWQMKAGEVIATTRRVPRHDLFGWPSAGAPW